MSESPELRQELEEERRELKEAVADLIGEIDEKTQQGKKLATTVGAAVGAVWLARTVLKLKRRSS
jgi:uncharacterized coiled-coil DUF342 family protein